MLRFYLSVVLLCATTVAAIAEDNPVVVELFTSQGCSSCPPAEALMQTLAEREDVIALSLHVDYWDYIGWKDQYANPGHAKRQRAYASAAGRRSVYTPEMIVNGESDIVGAKPMELAMLIEKHKKEPKTVRLDLSAPSKGKLTVKLQALITGLGEMEILLLRYVPVRETQITRGENAGRTLKSVNSVTNWTELGVWDGTSPFLVTTDIAGSDPVVVLAQDAGTGPIRGAAVLKPSRP